MAPRRNTEATERLRRVLLMVPYVTRRGGATFEELQRLTGAGRKELTEDLGVLFMTGTPPYLSGDLVEVSVDGDHVEISLADQIARPLTLSRAEAVALFVAGTALRSTLSADDPLVSALGKISDALGDGGAGGLTEIVSASEEEGPTHLPPLRAAVERRRVVVIDYFAASSGERSQRRVEPHAVFATDGRWYLGCWDIETGAERLLRVDRILGVTETPDVFEERDIAGAGRDLYTPGPDDTEVRLLVSPRAAWVAEFYRASRAAPTDDGWVEVTFPARHLQAIERLLLRLGADAKVVAPPILAEGARAAADRLLARYRAS